MPPSVSRSPDVVVLVHGTTFGQEPGSADAWWRPERVEEWLTSRLPPGTPVSAGDVITFRWSGRNSQVSRLDAGNELLALLLMLERRGVRYHLIGHSHGGSVIREALISSDITLRERRVYAELRRALNRPQVLRGERPLIAERFDEYAPAWFKHKTRYLPREAEYRAIEPFITLPGLRSWTTVGTPFLHYLPRRRPFADGWPGPRFSLRAPRGGASLGAQFRELLIMLILTGPFFFLCTLFCASAFGADWPRDVFRSPVTDNLALPYALLWAVTFFAIGRQGYARTLITRERAAAHVCRRFGARWLGLWSSSDEAITALSALAPKGPGYEWVAAPDGDREPMPPMRDSGLLPVPRLALPAPIVGTHLLPDHVRIAPGRLTAPVIGALNRWAEPWWRRRVAVALTRTCQGSDLPAAELAFVSPWLLPLTGAGARAGLPPDVDARIERGVGDRTGRLRPAVRQLLMTAALEGVPAAAEAVRAEHGTQAAGALVHTSYFDDPAVGKLVALHLAAAAGVECGAGEADPEARWLAAHREAVGERLRAFLGEKTQPASAPAHR